MAELLQDTSFRLWYIAGGAALLVAPMLWLRLWYHRNIGKTEGGRALAHRQRRSPPNVSNMNRLAVAVSMARDIAAGRYGEEARRMQSRVHWVTGLWIAALVVYVGLLLWAGGAARTPP